MDQYKHISFREEWEITNECAYMLGECEAYVKAITDIPLQPKARDELLQLSLIKGAQATTAIEGNTLKQEEIKKIKEGWQLPPSKKYLEIEVKNILDAFNTLLHQVITENKEYLLTPESIKSFHKMIGKDLGEYFDAIPGVFRNDNRFVGPYRTPDYECVTELMDKLCSWVRETFHYEKGQNFKTSIIQAIVTHVYIEWIHPFGDGNGRTGRLAEFYILLRAGLPSIVSHILSNYYNETRPEYYRQLDQARKNRSLTNFINYAVIGFRDGLKENLDLIQQSQFFIFWEHYIYEKFSNVKYTKKEAFKRKRNLMLQMPIHKDFSIDEIIELTPGIARRYATVKRPTVLRDLKELQELELLLKIGKKYRANTTVLRTMMPSKKT